MNYDNVKNPFDMYDDQVDIDNYEEFEELDLDEGEEENEPNSEVSKSNRLMNVIMIASYVLILILAFWGIIGLCNIESRNTIFHSVFFFM